MSRGRLKPENEKCIQQNYVYLKQNLKALDIVDYLYQHDVITFEDKELIRGGSTRAEQNEILLNIIHYAGPGEAFNYFLKSLEERHQHVLENIKRTVKQNCTEYKSLQDDINNLTSEIKTLKRKTEILQEENKKLKSERSTSKFSVDSEQDDKFVELNLEYILQKGKDETEMFLNGEKDISERFNECKKNPGHAEFIPYETFNINDLPQHFQTKNLNKYTQAMAELAVKIDVGLTSSIRPKFIQGTQSPYPLRNIRGTTIERSGSGFVKRIMKIERKINSNGQLRTCRCSKCKQSGQPNTEFWEIHVVTADQVVCNEGEAFISSARLFYDKHDSPLVLLNSCTGYYKSKNQPAVPYFMTYESCEANIGNKLQKNVDTFKKYSRLLKQEKYAIKDTLVFIVSHPHGGPKKLSIGRVHSLVYDSSKVTVVYKACTCPGSSGALISCLRYNTIESKTTLSYCFHSGALNSTTGYSLPRILKKD